MPPQLALLACFVFVGWLFRREGRAKPSFDKALWLPIAWMFFSGSRFPAQWAALIGIPFLGPSSDGSPSDAIIFFAMTVAGIRVLAWRGFSWSVFFRENTWLTVFFAYCLLSVLWSDFPFVSFKRWVKVLGHPVMALVILTSPQPKEALRQVMKRAAFLLLPLSVVFIKYFPQHGRAYEPWTGGTINKGISLSKNELGAASLIFALFFVWNLVSTRRLPDRNARRQELFPSIVFLLIVGYLLDLASSATAIACLILGAGTIIGLGFPAINPRRVGAVVITLVFGAVLAEPIFSLHENVVRMLGRDPTLTDRTIIWADLLAYPLNPLFGVGFESFWVGPRVMALWVEWPWKPNEAHNGYIETYINLGWIGLLILCGWILAAFHRSTRAFVRDFDFARFRLSFLLVIVAFSYTEAVFRGLSLLWTIFHIISIEYPTLRRPEKIAAAPPQPRAEAFEGAAHAAVSG